MLCIIGAMVFAPMIWAEDRGWFGNMADKGKDAKNGRGLNGVNGMRKMVNGVGEKEK